jgi:hypothetical protein
MPGRTRQRLFSKRLSPRPADSDPRLTATPDSSVFVNQTDNDWTVESAGELNRWLSQLEEQHRVTEEKATAAEDPTDREEPSPGGHEAENPVNHTQVVVPQEIPSELQALLANFGVNHTPTLVGRKCVFDEFLRGRLVSLLAMGLSIRQAAAAIGLSHNAVWKEMKRNPELTEQVNAARFQAQIEPLLVIVRESKRSWRAATWLLKHLRGSILKREETPDEMKQRVKEELRESDKEFRRRYAQPAAPIFKRPPTSNLKSTDAEILARLPESAKRRSTPEELAQYRAEANARREKVRKGVEARKAREQAAADAAAAGK